MSLLVRFMNSGTLPNGQSTVPMRDGALTIGRGEGNDLALPDPDRLLSKRHCVLEEQNGDYVIIDISTNGTFLNYGAERIGSIPAPLNNGDVIQLGTYELVIEIASAAADQHANEPLPPAGDSLIMPEAPKREFTGTDLDDPLDNGADPWESFFDEPLASPTPSGDKATWENSAQANDPLASHDLLGSADPLGSDDPFTTPYASAGPVLDEGLPIPVAPGGASEADHKPAEQEYFSAPAASATTIPDDWDDLLPPDRLPPESPLNLAQQEPPSSPEPANQGASVFDPRSNPFAEPEHAREAAPQFVQEPQSAQPTSPVPSDDRPVNAGHSEQPVLEAENAARAFLSGAGADHLNIPAPELAETMERLGRVFAATVAGMREILMARASIKSEMRMNRTMISMGGNNPLKFSISPEQAVEAMIRPSVRGYLDAEAATDEALKDIRAHEIAMMSGMEAALKDLLRRLSPDQLSDRIESGSTLGGLLGGKKARYWEAYEKMYAQIAKETEDDFQSTFGREFTRAYEEQLQKL
ncbi:type VI secretion system-associated FHA domain protein TagH [Roseibium algae]|uniref:Type VI secretion system-associated FHA domain protein TagH n=1 Tax=Roseibium algae TaxID=3123038 RepID=A0ABU8TED5_9HYPH